MKTTSVVHLNTFCRKLPIIGILSLSLISCDVFKEQHKPEEIKLNAPDNFDFATIKEVQFNFTSKDLQGNPVSIAEIGIYDKDPAKGGALLYVTGTNEDGMVEDYYSLPANLENVYLELNTPGVDNVDVPLIDGKVAYSITAPNGRKDGRVGQISAYPGWDGFTKGYLMFEDNWPKKGDFDLNDFVTKYEVALERPKIKNWQGRIKKITSTFEVIALGTGFDNGFGLHFPQRRSQAKLTSSEIDVANSSLVIQGVSYPVVPIDGPKGLIFEILKPSHLANDHLNTGRGSATCGSEQLPKAVLTIAFADVAGISSSRVGAVPFDMFLWVGKDIKREVHLIGGDNKKHTERGGTYAFDTNADGDIDGDYKEDKTSAKSGMPFAMIVPARINNAQGKKVDNLFNIPTERTQINHAYEKFVLWANSGGKTDADWYLTPKSGKVIPACK